MEFQGVIKTKGLINKPKSFRKRGGFQNVLKILQEYTQNKAYDILMKQKVLEKVFSFASLFLPKKSCI